MTTAGADSHPITSRWSEAIDRICQGFSGADQPGMVLGVVQSGDIVHRAAYGLACLEHALPMRVDSVLPIGSVSKHMCAAAVLRLEQAGKLNLHQDVRDYVPELPAFEARISLWHLLTMTSGLPDGLVLPLFAGDGASNGMSRSRHLEMLEKLPRLVFRPGDGLLYSNSNYMLLSLIIERVSGRSFTDYMRDEIFLPLGMASTQVVPWMHEPVRNRARGYTPRGDGDRFILQMSGDELCGDGGIHSTISDMLRWLAGYRADSSLRQGLEAESRLNDGRQLRYRLGLEVDIRDGVQKVSHGGGLPGYLADFAYFPQRDLGIVMMANSINPSMFSLADQILAIIHSPATGGRPASRAPGILEGVYVSIEPAYALELRYEEGLAICYMMGDRTPLERGREGVMVPLRRGMYFELRCEGSAPSDRLELRLGTERWLQCQRVVALDPEESPDIESYTGSYHNLELGETHHVQSDAEGRLYVSLQSSLRTLRWRILRHLIDGVFLAPVANEPSLTNVVLKFIRDRAGAVTGLEYNINRARGVYFSRIGD